jgi:hypothetical protein
MTPFMRVTAFFKFTACVALLGACSAITHAATVHINALADDPQWLALLHMQKNTLTGRYHSEVDAKHFFLSGKNNDSAAELRATVAALQLHTDDDSSAWCRFPARARFLSAHFTLQPPYDLQCNALNYWRSRFSADEIVLVYPDPYLKNIASIFGHTFLRIDARDKITHPILLSQTVSYYADIGTTDNNTALYIAKGLTGGFPGIIDLAPYFEKLRKYSDNEDRDIREYKLNLPPEKVRAFVDHVWEVRDNSFNYFFLDENCSYRLISMLDVITPTHNLRHAFVTHTIPVDTVKVLQEHGLIASYQYIPSAKKRFYTQYSRLSAEQKQNLLSLIKHPSFSNTTKDLPVLALAEQYHSIQIKSDPKKSLLHNLQANYVVRQEIATGEIPAIETAPHPAPDPAVSAHDTARLQTGWLRDGGKEYWLFGTRFAYHDFHDPLTTYQKGVQLDVLDFQFRVDTHETDNISLDSIRWFNLQSYSTSDIFFQDASWGLSVSRQRELIGEKNRLVNVAEAYRGFTTPCGAMFCHAELLGSVLTGGALDKAWDIRAGARAGVLYQNTVWSWSADISQQHYLVNNSNTLNQFNTEMGYSLARDWSLYASYTHQNNTDTQRNRFLISLRRFF